MQLVIAPTFAYKVTEQHSVGVSPLIGYQRFKADGLQGFAGLYFSRSQNQCLTEPGLTDNCSTGWLGVRFGYMGKLNDMVTVGAAYSSQNQDELVQQI